MVSGGTASWTAPLPCEVDNMGNDLIFSLDPGSVCTGWAVMRPPERLIRAGLLLPEKRTAPSEFRVAAMCHSLWQLLNLWLPRIILIEYGSGKVNPRRHHGQGSGLQVHGISVGALWREVVAWIRWQPVENQIGTKIHLIRENDWTRQVPKADRIDAIASAYQGYKAADDTGGDIADAIGLNIFYQRERAVRLVGNQR